ncbi:MAG: hypothetical protein A2511_13510 [Deltaproteobacteria bacterium RIFOXYD12_FULL_50_9]|nr:MAG: hypothetical protein A2511_13510 [Deltaproteobacteria bacterium RIFOXYD12_FULL_50_9]
MNTIKVAISMPSNLVSTIDVLSKKHRISRSKYISSLLEEKVKEEKTIELKEAYDRVFADESIQKEQLETLRFLQGADSSEGQEW